MKPCHGSEIGNGEEDAKWQGTNSNYFHYLVTLLLEMRSDLYEVSFVLACYVKDCQSLHRGLFSHSFVLDWQLSKPLQTQSCTLSVPFQRSLYGALT